MHGSQTLGDDQTDKVLLLRRRNARCAQPEVTVLLLFVEVFSRVLGDGEEGGRRFALPGKQWGLGQHLDPDVLLQFGLGDGQIEPDFGNNLMQRRVLEVGVELGFDDAWLQGRCLELPVRGLNADQLGQDRLVESHLVFGVRGPELGRLEREDAVCGPAPLAGHCRGHRDAAGQRFANCVQLRDGTAEADPDRCFEVFSAQNRALEVAIDDEGSWPGLVRLPPFLIIMVGNDGEAREHNYRCPDSWPPPHAVNDSPAAGHSPKRGLVVNISE